MDVLGQLILSLNKEEARNYKLFINRTNARENRKDAELFDFIRKQGELNYEDEKAIKKLYGNLVEKNNYYRLKNRIAADINTSLIIQHSNDSVENEVMQLLMLAKLFSARGNWNLASYYLKRAEKKARTAELFEILDIIYNEQIKLSHESLELDPNPVLDKKKANRKRLNEVQEIDEILAVIVYSVRKSQNFGKEYEGVVKMLDPILKRQKQSADYANNPVLRVKIYQAVSRVLLQQKSFVELESYLRKTYAEFLNDKLFTRQNHDVKLQMLTYLCNACFKNNKLGESSRWAEKLKEGLYEFESMLKDKYLFFYYNVQVNNFAKTDVERAIGFLNEALEHKQIKDHPYYSGYVYLNLSVSWFALKQYRQALRHLIKLMGRETFSSLDAAFKLKIVVFELIIRFEMEEFDFIEHRTKAIYREYDELLQGPDFSLEQDFLELIAYLSHASDQNRINKRIKQFLSDYPQSNEVENQIFDYSEWALSKMIK